MVEWRGWGLKERGFAGARRPGIQGPCCCEAAGEQPEEGGVGACRGEVDADAGGLLDNTGADFEQAQP